MVTPDGVTAAVETVIRRWGRLDVVVANAGMSTLGTFDTLDDAQWTRMREINLDGLIRLARASMPSLRASRGNFLAISSVAGFGGDWNQAGYHATKGAVNALIQSMTLDLGRHWVRLNAIAPAFTATRLTQARPSRSWSSAAPPRRRHREERVRPISRGSADLAGSRR